MEAPLVFVEGFLAFISPCVLPLVPVYLIYLAGKKGQEDRKTLIVNTLCFILGFTIVFVTMGATASGVGSLLASHRLLVQQISGIIIIIFGLYYMGILKIGFLNKDRRFSAKLDNLSALSSVVFGMAFSLGWTPCIGPFLGAALMKAANQDTIIQGMLLLLIFSLGLGIPFFLAAVAMEKLKSVFDFMKRHLKTITFVAGILLIVIGAAFLFDVFVFWAALFDY